MKNVLTIAWFTLFSTAVLMGQSKVGTIDTEYILSQMPELTKVQEDLKTYNTKLEAELKEKVEVYQAKVAAYQKEVATLTDPMKKTKQDEIIKLENDITKFRNNGTQLVQIEQDRLLQPLYQKIGKTLEEIAKAEKYTQVFTISTSGLAYLDPKFDVTQSVIKKLGIVVKTPATNTPSAKK
ncbi:OmpH family outer membrane protein [Aquimarina sp. ERC-38]|uniref:OmpH family outer membrane protein n=1 Tax=Aquimarina sp. ERC-38 TaxID=2949996 RepID=UPI002245EDEC|nr:OmpH family outer membrane protein [Aquimarina sp. ERC-38]UZO80426.1 OmpH family outer membrane protein [Aquimarina sp. ERC-38]